MIYVGSSLMCSDNCGALVVKCIGLKGLSKLKGATIGNVIIVSVKSKLRGTTKIWKGSIHHALIIWLKNKINWFKKNASYIQFFENNVVLLSVKNNFTPMGTRIFGPVSSEVWNPKFIKIILLSSGVF